MTSAPDTHARAIGPPRGPVTIDGWHSWFDSNAGIVLITAAALPVAALTVWALARRRRLNGAAPGWAWRASLAEVGMVHGTAPWIALTMLPGSGTGDVRVSLIPLRDLLTMPMYQIVGNLLIFAAAGFLGPVRFAAVASLRRILALAAAGSVLIETTQYVLPLNRVSSVDDVLLNTAGAGLAALASRRWWRASLAGEPSVRSGHRWQTSPPGDAPATHVRLQRPVGAALLSGELPSREGVPTAVTEESTQAPAATSDLPGTTGPCSMPPTTRTGTRPAIPNSWAPARRSLIFSSSPLD